jgi:phosphatidylinositol glycan class T
LSSNPRPPATQLTAVRSLRGSDQTRGGLTVHITNYLENPQRVYYVETMPWIIKFYLHTLATSIDSEPRLDIIQHPITYLPSNDRTPTLLEIPLLLPPLSHVQLSIDFEKVFLKYTEHPPDAQRGWDLPGAVVVPYALRSDEDALRTALEIQEAAKKTIIDENRQIREVGEDIPIPKTLVATDIRGRIYTPPLLADLATPDFSMPYNVIIMVGALVAYLFGSVFNLLTRKFVLVRVGEKGKTKEGKVQETQQTLRDVKG